MNLPSNFPALADLRETAAGINFNYFTVRKWTYRQLPAPSGWPAPVKVGRSLRYKKSDIENWIEGLGGNNQPATHADAQPRRGRSRKTAVAGGEK